MALTPEVALENLLYGKIFLIYEFKVICPDKRNWIQTYYAFGKVVITLFFAI